MPSVYKYGERKWSEHLLNNGGVRIGTIYDFRKDEHKRGIADATEGLKSVYHGIDNYNSNNPNRIDHAAITNISPFIGVGEVGFSIHNLMVERDFAAPDCYVHCTAHTLSRRVLEQFEKADSCIEIVRPAAFYRCLAEIINKRTAVHFYGFHRIVYSVRREKFNGENLGRRPDLMKEPAFEPQCEVRAIWIPKSKKTIEPFNLQERTLRRFCREVEVP
jgi:hypothetical protein